MIDKIYSPGGLVQGDLPQASQRPGSRVVKIGVLSFRAIDQTASSAFPINSVSLLNLPLVRKARSPAISAAYYRYDTASCSLAALQKSTVVICQ